MHKTKIVFWLLMLFLCFVPCFVRVLPFPPPRIQLGWVFWVQKVGFNGKILQIISVFAFFLRQLLSANAWYGSFCLTELQQV